MKVSVIIPVYRDSVILERCLASIFDTDFSDFEVIVVDDGSGEDYSKVFSKYPCKFIRAIENKGQAYARNIGVRESSGDILLFTDADCVVMKDWVLKFSQELIKSNYECKELVAVTGRLDSPNDFFAMCHAYTGYAYAQGGHRRCMAYLNTACVAVLKDKFWEVGGFSQDMRVNEDPDLAVLFVEHGYKVVFEPSIYIYHYHGIHTFSEFIYKHLNWGKDAGLIMEKKHKQRMGIFLPLAVNPATYVLLIIPIAIFTTIKIIFYNIKHDKRVLLYGFFIFLAKIGFRWGTFISSLTEKDIADKDEWKTQDKKYHEDEKVVDSYDQRITKKYSLEHKLFTLDTWIREFKSLNKTLILDYGCGTGNATVKLLKAGRKVVAIDASIAMLKKTQDKAEKEGFSPMCVVGDAENLPFKQEVFDGIVCLGVLHHLPDILRAVRNQVDVLTKDGLLFISEPFSHHPWFSFLYDFLISFGKFMRDVFRPNALRTHERMLAEEDVSGVENVLKNCEVDYSIRYISYWPNIYGYLSQAISTRIVVFFNRINGSEKRGESVVISVRRK